MRAVIKMDGEDMFRAIEVVDAYYVQEEKAIYLHTPMNGIFKVKNIESGFAREMIRDIGMDGNRNMSTKVGRHIEPGWKVDRNTVFYTECVKKPSYLE